MTCMVSFTGFPNVPWVNMANIVEGLSHEIDLAFDDMYGKFYA
jgi:hypothetical protein